MPASRDYPVLGSPFRQISEHPYGEAVQSNELQVCVARSRRTNRVGLNAGGGVGGPTTMEFSGLGPRRDVPIVGRRRWS